MLVVVLLLAVLRLSAPQCVPNCGCGPGCCLVVEESGEDVTVVGLPDGVTPAPPGTEYTVQGDSGIFSIDRNGVISTRRPLDREGEADISTTVGDFLCISLGILVPELRLVNIKVTDINDNPPEFSMSEYSVEIPETTATDPTYQCTPMVESMLTATDADRGPNAEIRYEVRGNANFEIRDPATPCVQNIDGFELDYDTLPRNYSFTLVATNLPPSTFSAETTVTYVLTDRNDNPPVFDGPYDIPIKETLTVGSEVFQFRARDLDSGNNGEHGLSYNISVGHGVFEINPASGNLTLVRMVDAESGPDSYSFMVTTMDGGDPSQQGSASVMVTITDVNEPARYQTQSGMREITENEVLQRIVVLINLRDDDRSPANNNVSLEIIGGKGVFQIMLLNLPTDGITYALQQVRPVDFEQNSTVQILLRTTERGEPFISQDYMYNLTVIDVNDNRPGLAAPSFSILEETPGDRVIGDLSQHVFDLDSGANGRVGTYELISVANSTTDLTFLFEGTLDLSSGVLRTGNAMIDREELGNMLTYTVNITDTGSPPLSKLVSFTVTILDVNDHEPVFDELNYIFTVEEGGRLRMDVVGTVHASDPDYEINATVRYSILDEDSQFWINSVTGAIRSDAEFDREMMDTYVVTVTAHDGGGRTAGRLAQVTITISDVEDEDPVFSDGPTDFEVTTSLSVGSVVGMVVATDTDLPPHNTIMYALETNSSLFSIRQQHSGGITLDSPFPGVGNFTLNVSAFNPGRRERGATKIVTIFVTKVPLDIALIAGAAGGATLLLLLIIVLVVVILCTYRWNSRHGAEEITGNAPCQGSPGMEMKVIHNDLR